MKKWLMSLSKAVRYFVVLLPLIIFGIFILTYAAFENIILLIVALIALAVFFIFLYFNGQVEKQIKKDKENTVSDNGNSSSVITPKATTRTANSTNSKNSEIITTAEKEFNGSLYSIVETDGKNGRKSRKSIIRAIYWKDGQYAFLFPKIVTLNDEGSFYSVLVNNEKIGEINDDSYNEIKTNYAHIALMEVQVEHEREYGNNDYEPWLKVLYCTKKRLAQFPEFNYTPRGQRVSEFCKPHFLNEYVVIDTETTNVNPETSDIVEISALHIKDGNPISQFSEKIYSNKITSESTAINHITFTDVATARHRNEVLNDFVAFIGTLPVLGHNVNFDISFICTSHPIGNPFDDTCLLAEEFLKTGEYGIKISNSKLPTVCEALKVELKNAHSSLSDCIATYQCYEKLKTLLNNQI